MQHGQYVRGRLTGQTCRLPGIGLRRARIALGAHGGARSVHHGALSAQAAQGLTRRLDVRAHLARLTRCRTEERLMCANRTPETRRLRRLVVKGPGSALSTR
jgi:hypothetical protein